jgi:hypothetical protein
MDRKVRQKVSVSCDKALCYTTQYCTVQRVESQYLEWFMTVELNRRLNNRAPGLSLPPPVLSTLRYCSCSASRLGTAVVATTHGRYLYHD